jgi:ABC-type arginine transport system permease subunit
MNAYPVQLIDVILAILVALLVVAVSFEGLILAKVLAMLHALMALVKKVQIEKVPEFLTQVLGVLNVERIATIFSNQQEILDEIKKLRSTAGDVELLKVDVHGLKRRVSKLEDDRA